MFSHNTILRILFHKIGNSSSQQAARNSFLNHIKKEFDAKPESKRTQQDVDKYNKAVNEFNDENNQFNNTNANLNGNRSKFLDNWNKSVSNFTDNHVPNK